MDNPPWIWRFLSKISVGDGCHEWAAGRFSAGYGAFSLGGRQQKAHRVMWMLHYGEIPSGMYICHHCDNPPCCRIDHLYLGTAQDNMSDKMARGRHVTSPRERNGMWGVRKTHCAQGHPLVDENVYENRGQRRCAICRRERTAASNAKISAARRVRDAGGTTT